LDQCSYKECTEDYYKPKPKPKVKLIPKQIHHRINKAKSIISEFERLSKESRFSQNKKNNERSTISTDSMASNELLLQTEEDFAKFFKPGVGLDDFAINYDVSNQGGDKGEEVEEGEEVEVDEKDGRGSKEETEKNNTMTITMNNQNDNNTNDNTEIITYDNPDENPDDITTNDIPEDIPDDTPFTSTTAVINDNIDELSNSNDMQTTHKNILISRLENRLEVLKENINIFQKLNVETSIFKKNVIKFFLFLRLQRKNIEESSSIDNKLMKEKNSIESLKHSAQGIKSAQKKLNSK